MDNWLQILSLVLNFLFGSGFLISLLTIKSVKQKASIEVDTAKSQLETSEIQNVERAVQIWREMSEKLSFELSTYQKNNAELTEQFNLLKREVNRLNVNIKQVIKLLDEITPENLKEVITEIKAQIDRP